MELIDKDALIAEIEKRRGKNARNKLNLAASFEDNYLLSFIDTLEVKEVKEVNLDMEINLWVKNLHKVPNFEELNKFAKHFFELGLKTKE